MEACDLGAWIRVGNIMVDTTLDHKNECSFSILRRLQIYLRKMLLNKKPTWSCVYEHTRFFSR